MSIRISIPETASKGEVIEVKTLIQHAMESGFRRDGRGKVIPRDILTKFECQYKDEVVFSADFFPAIAANPLLSFFVKATESGTLLFRWTDQSGEVWEETRELRVT